MRRNILLVFCAVCGKKTRDYSPHHTKKFCSVNCKQKAYYYRVRANNEYIDQIAKDRAWTY